MAIENARVVRVLSDYEVVINVGKSAGVRTNASVKIYTLGDMIKDFETGEELERLEIVRGIGRVTNVQDKISTIRSAETLPARKTVTRIPRSSQSSIWSSMLSSAQITEETPPPEVAPFASPQVGDRVVFT
jgi:hypothetical protein